MGDNEENRIDVNPIPLTREEFKLAGYMAGKTCTPFNNLHVQVQNQVVSNSLLNIDNDDNNGKYTNLD